MSLEYMSGLSCFFNQNRKWNVKKKIKEKNLSYLKNKIKTKILAKKKKNRNKTET